MNLKHYKLILIVLTTGVLITSCGGVNHIYKRPDLQTNDLYRDVNTADTTGMGLLSWKTVFNDPDLQNLIQEGLSKNLDLLVAIERIKEAEATLVQSKAALYPTINGGVNAVIAHSTASAKAPSAGYNDIALSASWEADLWGKLSSTKRANLAALLEEEAYKKLVQTELVANIANSYYSLLALDTQLAITKETVENRIEDVKTMKELKEGAVTTGADVVQSEANRYAAEVTIPDLKRNIRETENALCILLGKNPETIKRSTLEEQKQSASLQTGVPALLLSNRPDVQQSEYAFRYAFEKTNVAEAYFYPAITISATGGLSNSSLDKIFSGALFGNLIGGLTQPIFNQKINKTRLKIAQVQQEEALLNYKKTLLSAGQEVSNALYSYQTAQEKGDVRAKQIASLNKAVEYTMALLKYGASNSNYTEVLTAEQNLLSAQLSNVNDKLQKLQAVVSLYRSLGGGWQ